MPNRNEAMIDLFSQQWAMEPRALQAFANRVVSGELLSFAPGNEEEGKRPKLRIENGTAHIPIEGPILKNASSLRAWGIKATSTKEIAQDIDAALSDESVSNIRLDIDSPGGITTGVVELGEKIASADTKKPVTAHTDDMMASAAYWIGSQAREITANKSATIGSIGVFTVVRDTSAAAEKAGVRINVVSSHPLKGAGVDGSKVTSEQLSDTQRLVNSYFNLFADAVSRGRKMSAEQVASVATGQVWLAEEAGRLGLIDSVVGQQEESASAMVALDEQKSPQTGAQRQTMAEKNSAPVAGNTATNDESEEIKQLRIKVAEGEAFKAQALAVRGEELIERYKDRIAPTAMDGVKMAIRAYGESLDKAEEFLKGLPVVVRGEALSASVQPANDPRMVSKDDLANNQLRKHLSIDGPEHQERIEKLAENVSHVRADGKAVLNDGRVMTKTELFKHLGIVAAMVAMLVCGTANATALTQARQTECKGQGITTAYLMTASKTIYAGSLVMVIAAGTAEAAAASASNVGVVGVAQETKTSAASGSYWIKVTDKVICKYAGDTLAQTSVGNLAYADDDQTVDETQATNAPVAGILVKYDSASVGWVYIDGAVNMGRINAVTEPLSLTGSLTLSQGLVVSQPSNNVLRMLENSEDEDVTFSSNKLTVSSNTGVVTHDFSAIGVRTTKPLMLLGRLRFCGNGANGTTPWYDGPVLPADYASDMSVGAAGCDANDSSTEATADRPFNAVSTIKVVGMACFTQAGGAADTNTYQLRSATADVSGVTCTVTNDGSNPKTCSVILDAPVTITAGATLAVKNVMSGSDDMSAKDMGCEVFYTF